MITPLADFKRYASGALQRIGFRPNGFGYQFTGRSFKPKNRTKLTSDSATDDYVPIWVMRERRLREVRKEVKNLNLRGVNLCDGAFTWLLGPEYVQSVRQIYSSALSLSELGFKVLRAKAYWKRAKEKDFQRHLLSGLRLLQATARHFDMAVVSEVVFAKDVELVGEYCDIIEVSPRGYLDSELIKELANIDRIIIMRRNPLMPMEQFLGLLSFLERGGGKNIALAEVGVKRRKKDDSWFLDFSSTLALRSYTDHPVFIDCSSLAKSEVSPQLIMAEAMEVGAIGILGHFAVETSHELQDSKANLGLEGEVKSFAQMKKFRDFRDSLLLDREREVFKYVIGEKPFSFVGNS